MSNDNAFLALRLECPMQSWGFDSQFNRRNTGLWPTKSALAGMICAAYGYNRGSENEKDFLKQFSHVKMTAIAIPRMVNLYGKTKQQELMVRRLTDYHTVGGGYNPDDPWEYNMVAPKADKKALTQNNKNKYTVLTYRQYLTDANFGIILSGEKNLLESAGIALNDPKWGIWLGRKSCVPTSPVYGGLFNNEIEAINHLLDGDQISKFTRQVEVKDFAEGKDSITDQAISFDSSMRKFSPRRVVTIEGKK